MIENTKSKIEVDLRYINKHAEEALYYIFCLVESYCLGVELVYQPDDSKIRKFFETQKSRLLDNGATISYNGPNFRDVGKKEMKYVLNLKHFTYKKNESLNLAVDCFYGYEYHKDIAIENEISMEITEKNGTNFCSLIFAGTIENMRFQEKGIVMNIIGWSMPEGFKELGEMINFFILKHFGIDIKDKL
ncbi:MAG: hypothetical protein GY754_11590 [bacterium]|nr:hypothetical protein [bacterium]